ncbi:MAG: 1,4-dihydroxy-2-naphthoate polyprenyltransferase [candidate division Zixibacteria bacterium]|nr:1,4-dihydroxy-2-naphthoate polyprenyltransferase [candidate division Zixibacteria bacterium]
MALSTFQIWLLAVRPRTLAAAVAPVVIGSAMAGEWGAFSLLPALAAMFGAVMIQIGTNFANDYFDFKSGADRHKRLGPTRVTQAGLVKPEIMKRAIVIAFTLAIAAGLYLVWRGGWPILIIGLLSIIAGILYTAGPYPLGYNGLGDIFVLVFFGPVAVGGTFYVQALTLEIPIVLLAGLAPGLFSVAILTVNNLRDIAGDTATGKRTLAVRFGRTFSIIEYISSVVIACVIPLLLFILTGRHPYTLLTMLVPFVAFPSIRQILTSSEGSVLNDILSATGRLLLLYSVIFSIGWQL